MRAGEQPGRTGARATVGGEWPTGALSVAPRVPSSTIAHVSPGPPLIPDSRISRVRLAASAVPERPSRASRGLSARSHTPLGCTVIPPARHPGWDNTEYPGQRPVDAHPRHPPLPPGASTRFFPGGIGLGNPFSRLQSFLYVRAPTLARPPDCTYRCRVLYPQQPGRLHNAMDERLPARTVASLRT